MCQHRVVEHAELARRLARRRTGRLRFVVVMLLLSWQLAILVIALIPLVVVPMQWLSRRAEDRTTEYFERLTDLNAQFVERAGPAASLLFKIDVDEATEQSCFEKQANMAAIAGVRASTTGRVFFAVLGSLGLLASAAVYLVGGIEAVHERVTIGTLVALAALTGSVVQPVLGVASIRLQIVTMTVAFGRVRELWSMPPESDGSVIVAPRFSRDRSLVFEKVCYRHGSSDAPSPEPTLL